MASYPIASSGIARAQQILARNGLDKALFCKRNTPGDGNCFFHAIVDQLTDDEIRRTVARQARGIMLDHMIIRQKVTEFARQHEQMILSDDTIFNMLIFEEERDRLRNPPGRDFQTIYRDYIREKSQIGNWATELLVRITAIYFQKNIRAIKENFVADWSGGQDAQYPEFVIVNMDDSHFQSVHRIPGGASSASHRSVQASASQPVRRSKRISQCLQMGQATPHRMKQNPTQVRGSPIPTSQQRAKTTGPNNRNISKVLCKKCGREFEKLNVHLSRNADCRAAYNRPTNATSSLPPSGRSVASSVPAGSQATSKGKGNILDAPCRNCGKSFTRLTRHLTQRPTCLNAYEKAELDEAKIKKAKELKRQNNLEFRMNHPDYDKKYKESHLEEAKQYAKQYRQSHLEEAKLYAQLYGQSHPDEAKQRLQRHMRRNYSFVKDIKFNSTGEGDRLKAFVDDIRDGWAYVCVCCCKQFFRRGVINPFSNSGEMPMQDPLEKQMLDLKKHMEAIKPGLFHDSIDVNFFRRNKIRMSYNNTVWICHTCWNGHIKKGRVPPQSAKNGLTSEEIPKELILNDLGTTLIAKRILFMKISKLPVSRWSTIKDKTVMIPINDEDILHSLEAVNALPRTPDQACLIPVQLKRKKSLTNKVIEAFIDPVRLVEAVRKLKELGHPSYQAININENFVQIVQDKAAAASQGMSDMNQDSEDESEEEDVDLGSTLLTDKFPESSVVVNTSSKEIRKKRTAESKKFFAIAPGEGKIPSNLMRDKNWDIDSFPTLHPTGMYGLNFKRNVPLSAQKYFQQRIENISKKWSNCTPFVFAALNFLERQQIEGQINISCRRGKVVGEQLVPLQDPFSVFDKIPGTQRYWQQKRYEVLARIEQLGPFHLFFTLSCADKRWGENFSSILIQRGIRVDIDQTEEKFTEGAYVPGDIKVKSDRGWISLEDYLELHNESEHEMIKENVLTVTKNFDNRVRSFMKHIVMANPDLKVEFFNYRVEFQRRGAGHIHGVLWLDMKVIDPAYPGLQAVFKKLGANDLLTLSEKGILTRFIDDFISCSTQNDAKEIVEEVQHHHHKRTCYKRGDNCRFSFPKFPSDETIIAQPLDKKHFSPEKYKEEVKRNKNLLSRVKDVLVRIQNDLKKGVMTDDELEDMNLDDILARAEVDKECYKRALSISSTGTVVVLKRRPCEMMINNYNQEWIKAWNANMDIQVCLDVFAIVTYITDYYMKDESGMAAHLQTAAKECKGQERLKQLRYLAHKFLTHREMGESEAYYRMLPALHLSESNIKCQFVATGFQEDRSKFFMEVKTKNTDRVIQYDSDEEEIDGIEPKASQGPSSFISIPGFEGKTFKETATSIQKYVARPQHLKGMCLAQFIICYDRVNMTREQSKTKITNEGCSDVSKQDKKGRYTQFIVTSTGSRGLILPQYIQLSNNMGFMRLRRQPCVLRTHKYGRQSAHKHMYSEILLYRPFQHESEIIECAFNIEKCTDLFNQRDNSEDSLPPEDRKSLIIRVKEQIFPYKNIVEEARKLLEDSPNKRPEHIGDQIDAEFEQESGEGIAEGTIPDNEFAFRDPGTMPSDLTASVPTKESYKRIDISDRVAMHKSARQLDREQRRPFDQIMEFCKNTRKAKENPNVPFPKPPLLKIHGGAGCGKSKLINDLSLWAEYWLTQASNRDPSHPSVVKAAPTGKAASIIEGHTMHTAFNFSFGNNHFSLSDEMRSSRRAELSELKIVVVDEMSMIKSDQLYQLHMRLSEITQNEDEFGGIAVLMVGDLMQLKPIGKWIFDEPAFAEYRDSFAAFSLWDRLTPIELTQNHRQGENREWAEVLNRIRVGLQTEADLKLLQSRVTTQVPDDALFVYGHRVKVAQKNAEMINKMAGMLYTFFATHHHDQLKNYKPIPEKDGLIKNTGFFERLHLKIGAKVMIVYNLDTADGLTNGASGIVQGFIKKDGSVAREAPEVYAVLVDLDEIKWGERCRQENAHLLRLTPFKRAVPIVRMTHEYSIGAADKQHLAKAKLIQFPLTLSFAITAHKCQGQTIKPPNLLVADIADMFGPGMTYVVLGRVQNINQLHLLSFDERKIIVSPDALREAKKIHEMSKQVLLNDIFHRNWTDEGQSFDTLKKIATLNVRSLGNKDGHIADVRADHTLLHANILCLTETWCFPEAQVPVIAGFKCFSASHGTGKGVAMYVKNEVTVPKCSIIAREAFQMVRLEFRDLIVIGAYRSPSNTSAKDKEDFITALSDVQPHSKPAVICGDMNIRFDPSKPGSNPLTADMLKNGFKQVVNQPTHIRGNILDHIYVRYPQSNSLLPPLYKLHYPYYSDHDAPMLMIKRKS